MRRDGSSSPASQGTGFSAHCHDQFDRWRGGETLRMRWDEAAIRSDAVDTLTLRG